MIDNIIMILIQCREVNIIIIIIVAVVYLLLHHIIVVVEQPSNGGKSFFLWQLLELDCVRDVKSQSVRHACAAFAVSSLRDANRVVIQYLYTHTILFFYSRIFIRLKMLYCI